MSILFTEFGIVILVNGVLSKTLLPMLFNWELFPKVILLRDDNANALFSIFFTESGITIDFNDDP